MSSNTEAATAQMIAFAIINQMSEEAAAAAQKLKQPLPSENVIVTRAVAFMTEMLAFTIQRTAATEADRVGALRIIGDQLANAPRQKEWDK